MTKSEQYYGWPKGTSIKTVAESGDSYGVIVYGGGLCDLF